MIVRNSNSPYKGKFETAGFVRDAMKAEQAKRVLAKNPRTKLAEILTDVLEEWGKVQLQAKTEA